MSFNKTKNMVQDSPLSGAQIDGRIPMRRIMVIADLIGDGHDMLTNAKAHRHPVGGTTDADFLMLCRRPGAIRRAHESELRVRRIRSEEHTSELQSLMRISYAVFCLKKKKSK